MVKLWFDLMVVLRQLLQIQMQITERTASSILTSSSSQVFSDVYLFILWIFERHFGKVYNLVVYNNVCINLRFLPIFITYPYGIILWKTSLIIHRANIVTVSLSVPKLHNSFKTLKGLYYFDMIRRGVLHLCTLYNTLLEPKLTNLTWKHIDFLCITIICVFLHLTCIDFSFLSLINFKTTNFDFIK